MAFYKLYTVYYTEKWATLKLIQDMEETLLSFAQNYTVFLIETVITREWRLFTPLAGCSLHKLTSLTSGRFYYTK